MFASSDRVTHDDVVRLDHYQAPAGRGRGDYQRFVPPRMLNRQRHHHSGNACVYVPKNISVAVFGVNSNRLLRLVHLMVESYAE